MKRLELHLVLVAKSANGNAVNIPVWIDCPVCGELVPARHECKPKKE